VLCHPKFFPPPKYKSGHPADHPQTAAAINAPDYYQSCACCIKLAVYVYQDAAYRHSIWSRTASSSQTLVNADCDLRTSTLVLSCIQERTLVTGAFQLLACGGCGRGTVYQWRCASQPHVEIKQLKRRFYFSETAAHSNFFCLCAA